MVGVEVGLVLGVGGEWEVHTRLLCCTDSGTRGLMSRDSSCFVGAILIFSLVFCLLEDIWMGIGLRLWLNSGSVSLRLGVTAQAEVE